MHQQQPFAQSMQPEYFRQEHQRNNSQILSSSIQSDQNNLKTSLKKQSLIEEKTAGHTSSNINNNSIFNILKSKLAGPQGSHLFKEPIPTIRAEI